MRSEAEHIAATPIPVNIQGQTVQVAPLRWKQALKVATCFPAISGIWKAIKDRDLADFKDRQKVQEIQGSIGSWIDDLLISTVPGVTEEMLERATLEEGLALVEAWLIANFTMLPKILEFVGGSIPRIASLLGAFHGVASSTSSDTSTDGTSSESET